MERNDQTRTKGFIPLDWQRDAQLDRRGLSAYSCERFDIVSSAVEHGASNPLANEVMKEAGIDISGHEPKSIAQSVKESFSYVIAIFDTAKERSPVFPVTLRPSHWSIADPSSGGLPGPKTEVFRRVRDEIKVRQFIAGTAQIKPSELSIA